MFMRSVFFVFPHMQHGLGMVFILRVFARGFSIGDKKNNLTIHVQNIKCTLKYMLDFKNARKEHYVNKSFSEP